MKKFILWPLAFLWIASVALFSFSTPRQAVAQEAQTHSATLPTVGGYACIRTDNAYFYQTKHNDSGLFLLPESYFVKILETGETYCKIEYLYDDMYVKKMVGYAQTAQLTFVDFVPERPYLYCLFNLRYTLNDSIEGNGFLDDITVLCAYYGDYTVGSKTYCYVLQGEEFGYVPKPNDLIIEKSTEYADKLASSLPPTQDDTPTSDTSSQSNPAQIAILVALCLLVPILAALILKPPRRPPYETE